MMQEAGNASGSAAPLEAPMPGGAGSATGPSLIYKRRRAGAESAPPGAQGSTMAKRLRAAQPSTGAAPLAGSSSAAPGQQQQ